MCFTETGLTDNSDNQYSKNCKKDCKHEDCHFRDYIPKEFSIYSSYDPSKQKGSGVLIAVRNNIFLKSEKDTDFTSDFGVCGKIQLRNKKWIWIYCTYIPRGQLDKYNTLINNVKKLYEKAENDTIIVLGDFNVSGVYWESEKEDLFAFRPIIVKDATNEQEKFLVAMKPLGLSQLCNFKNDSKNVLDLVYTNRPKFCKLDIGSHEETLNNDVNQQPHHPLELKIRFSSNYRQFDRNANEAVEELKNKFCSNNCFLLEGLEQLQIQIQSSSSAETKSE